MNQRAREANALLHAVTEAFDEAVLHVRRVRDLHDLRDAHRALRRGNAERGAEEVQVFPDAHVVVRAEHVRHVADQPLDLLRVLDAVDAVDQRHARRRPNQATRILIVVVLPAPFGPMNPRISPEPSVKVRSFKRRERSVLLRQVFDDERGPVGRGGG